MLSVCVLLSTYNGENFLKKQIDSILNQKGVEVYILARDDGSSDQTVDILKRYNQSQLLEYYIGKNKGPANSFIDLIKNAGNFDYYAYCDQDDVWNDDKLLRAVNKLEAFNDRPGLYSCELEKVDDNLKHIENSDFHKEPYSLGETIVGRAPSGCTMVFNKKLRDVIANSEPSHVRMHDYWSLLTVLSIGGVFVADHEYVGLKYRLHENNTVGMNKGISIRIKRLLNSYRQNPNERSLQAKAIYENYKPLLTDEAKDTLETIINYRKGFCRRFLIITDKRFTTMFPHKNLLFKISCVLGRF